LALLCACSDNPEQAALDAYRAGDFARAAGLARDLAAAEHPRGYEIQALLAAQGLDGALDFTRARALAKKAAVLDSAYAGTIAAIEQQVAASEAAAERAFADRRYDRAFALAEALSAAGSVSGAALEETLLAGQYLRLPGSQISWHDFWTNCSGNIRQEGIKTEIFERECLGRGAVWEGVVVAAQAKQLSIKMTPGRSHARSDLALHLDQALSEDQARRLGRVRFSGLIAKRGTVSEPDELDHASLLGAAAPLPSAPDQAEASRRAVALGWCRRALEVEWRRRFIPEWFRPLMEAARRERVPRAQLRHQVEIDQSADAFAPTAAGGLAADIAGRLEVVAIVWNIPDQPMPAPIRASFTARCDTGPLAADGTGQVAQGTVAIAAASLADGTPLSLAR